jgi:hypothetical protein
MAKKNYQLDAHSTASHGSTGQAVGLKSGGIPATSGAPTPTNEERGVTYAQDTDGAAHLPRAGAAHKFAQPPAPGAHGFGHPAHVRSGPLRNSGHKSAHRVGKR